MSTAVSQRREVPTRFTAAQPNGLSRGAPMRFNAHAKGGIKNWKGATELELNFSARRPIKWAAYELFSRSETVRVPGGNMPPVHRPPGAASSFLILPRSVTRSRQRAVPVIGLGRPEPFCPRVPPGDCMRPAILKGRS